MGDTMIRNESPWSVSAVIPVYNDKESLTRAIPVALRYLEQITPAFELIIAEDASTDGSYELACEWAEKDERVRVLHRDKRLGRGSALNNAASSASGDIFCYFDVDLATDMIQLPGLIISIRNGNDIAIGSRLLKGSTVIRRPGRELKSRAYNFFSRIWLGSSIRDHQCGFKAFHRIRMLRLLPKIQDTHWFWDTELLAYAEREGYHIEEIPVIWKEGRGTTVKNSDVILMGRSILSLWVRFLKQSLFPSSMKDQNTESSVVSSNNQDLLTLNNGGQI